MWRRTGNWLTSTSRLGKSTSQICGAAVDVPHYLSKSEAAPLRQPAPLFKKLDESVVEQECARLEA